MGKLNFKLIRFINFLNMGINNRRLTVEYDYHPMYINILEKLLKLNLIDGFFFKKGKLKKNSHIVIFFKYNQIGENLIKVINNKYSKPYVVSWKKSYLKNLTVKKKLNINSFKVQKSFFLLTTNKGILTTQETIENNIGGILFLQVVCN